MLWSYPPEVLGQVKVNIFPPSSLHRTEPHLIFRVPARLLCCVYAHTVDVKELRQQLFHTECLVMGVALCGDLR